ncbi:copper amine oxidase N-terminal domain-containing protein [Paenibacillus spongiae]|uniref:Copper amine oxidase N-terminal domain-containing protein n=1 Tax=Paenibacillus spongiae TaxID=2909671 RepID=A0ABY5S5U1_9BACL|nr:copper amine oxidase N-terminal domain-containing protein [Paenibacillus spongiae]UVI29267.1 copper amine oxidase N-terminal domain-containing protein [Paenibacillus spongiae]
MKKKLTILLTLAGILGTTAAVGAEDLVEKVTGYLQKDVKVLVNGQDSMLTPVYIDGKAYIPVRDAATKLGYTLNYDEANKEIELDEAADLMRASGVIVSVQAKEDGKYRIELLGSTWVILTVDKSTAIKSLDGKTLTPTDLKAGTQIDAEFGPAMAMSFPGQAQAVSINVHADRAVKEDTIKAVKHTDDGWQVQLGDALVLNAGKETRVMTSQGESVNWEDLKAGTKVKAYYGPFETKSLPPQSPVFLLVVQVQAPVTAGLKMSPETAQEYRNLAWAQVSAQASHITTKQDEAAVHIVSSNEVGVLAPTAEQKKLLEDVQAANGNFVTVTYNTDQDELLGPLTVVFDFNTKAFIGFNARR